MTSLHDYPGAVMGRTEGPLLDWFRHHVKRGETWLDVGAHYGYTAIALAELVGPDGRVLAFEPSVSTAGHLARTRVMNHLSQLTVVPLGLGEAGPLRMLSVTMDRGMANHNLGGTRSEDIFVIGFDDFWQSVGEHRVDGVKIDVQGMELDVLKGMAGMLREQRPELAIEFHTGVVRSPILDLVQTAGYELPGSPIDPMADGSVTSPYRDNHSYAFRPRTG